MWQTVQFNVQSRAISGFCKHNHLWSFFWVEGLLDTKLRKTVGGENIVTEGYFSLNKGYLSLSLKEKTLSI